MYFLNVVGVGVGNNNARLCRVCLRQSHLVAGVCNWEHRSGTTHSCGRWRFFGGECFHQELAGSRYRGQEIPQPLWAVLAWLELHELQKMGGSEQPEERARKEVPT